MDTQGLGTKVPGGSLQGSSGVGLGTEVPGGPCRGARVWVWDLAPKSQMYVTICS